MLAHVFARREAPSKRCTGPRWLELLEARRLMATDVPEVPVDPAPPEDTKEPTVEAVFVNSTSWTPQFRAYLEAQNQGSTQYGFEADLGEFSGGENLNSHILPWIGINQVSFQFDENVSVQQDDLIITGTSQTAYGVTAFTYDPTTFVATWTLDRPIGNDVLDLRLDGTSEDRITDTAGNPLKGNCQDQEDNSGEGSVAAADQGRDFCQGLAVLPGDVTQDGRVNALDLAAVRRRLGTNTASPNMGRAQYDPIADVTGDGRINALDLAAVRQRFGSRLPEQNDDNSGEG